MLRANGTLFGQPYQGPIPVPSADGSATLVTGAFLLGWPLGGSASGAGAITPYVGVGGGIDRTAATFGGQVDSRDVGGALQAIAGVGFGVGRRVSAFAEYRYHRLAHQLAVGTQTVDFTVKPNHVVAGFMVRLF
jgi:hypothetical protein